MFKDIIEFFGIIGISSLIFRVLDKIIFVDVIEVVDLLLILHLAVVLNGVKIIIMQFSDENFQLVCIFVQMDISNLFLSKSGRQLFYLLSLLFLLFIFLQGFFIFNVQVLFLNTSADFLLHGILFLHHLPLQRDV